MLLCKIWNIFDTLTSKQIFLKTKAFCKKLENIFLVESTKAENTTFSYETVSFFMLIKIEPVVQNARIAKYVLLPVTTLLF